MARLARVVVPGIPHHITQRGNGRAQTFFCDQDYIVYRDLLRQHTNAAQVKVWAWVLMPNHVHLVLVPEDEDGFRRALSQVHRAYAGYIHARMKRTGHFWQGRFGCVAMDDQHAYAALRYVIQNPVRAGLVRDVVDWRWSSIHACLGQEQDQLTDVAAVRARFPDMRDLTEVREEDELVLALRQAETIGRPLGDETFLDELEKQMGRRLRPAKRGAKPRHSSDNDDGGNSDMLFPL